MLIADFRETLSGFSEKSSFPLEVSDVGGYLEFGNSGRRGEIKYFCIGLGSVLSVLNDIDHNLRVFRESQAYDEKNWRSLGSEYFSDRVANALSTVQTKPLFTVLSKVICWANRMSVEECDFDNYIDLDQEKLSRALDQLQELIIAYTPGELRFSSSSLGDLSLGIFVDILPAAGLKVADDIAFRFVASLCTKPFVLLTGLSGSGKTKLAQAFAQWICESDEQYRVVPVGADWTNREPLLGYPNALNGQEYVKPDSGVIDLLLSAQRSQNKPHFLILDEMNLSHVERYFADFLSVLESDEPLFLHSSTDDMSGVPSRLSIPPNFFVIGTVNVDETTYMFSPKVLDRANVLEFRVEKSDVERFLDRPVKADLDVLSAKGSGMGQSFVQLAKTQWSDFSGISSIKDDLVAFFDVLKKVGAEFGYRTMVDIFRFAQIMKRLEVAGELSDDKIFDAAIIQKLLPKLHGSRRRIEPVLVALASLCFTDSGEAEQQLSKPDEIDLSNSAQVRYPLSLDKIIRMLNRVRQDGFTSFAEA